MYEGRQQDGRNYFFAAECMEFPERLGELRENLTLPEAVDAYRGFAGGTAHLDRESVLCLRMKISLIIPASDGRYIRAGGWHRR